MRILFLTPQLPEPLHAGNILRNNGLMRGTHAAGHEVHLLTFAEPEQLLANRKALDEFCASVEIVPPPRRKLVHRLRDLVLTSLADMQRRLDSPLFAIQLEKTLAQTPFDLIQIEGLEMAGYLPVIQRIQPGTPVIYDAHNAEFALQKTIYEAEKHDLQHLPGALYSLVQWRRLVRFEHRIGESAAHIVTVSEADAEALRTLLPGRPVSVIPNGIDVLPYTYNDTSLDLGEHALVFTGSMNYRPNVDAALWFANQILGKVREQVPDAKFFIVGSQPHRRLDTLREMDGVEITGWVQNVNPFLHAAAVYVVPLRMGSGTRLKLLQAMAAGQAVVSTSIGALGLGVRDGCEVRLADTAETFARAVIELLRDPAARHALGTAGRQHIQKHYDWSVIVPRLLEIYDSIMRSPSNRGLNG